MVPYYTQTLYRSTNQLYTYMNLFLLFQHPFKDNLVAPTDNLIAHLPATLPLY